MEKPYSQNFENHARVVTGFHKVALPIFALNFFWAIYRLVRSFSSDSVFARLDSVLALLLAVALLLLFFYARIFALTVQDRVIRLEMTLRLERLLPPDLRLRMHEFTVSQLVALRFAGDAELPDLARRVLAENLTERKAIKRMIKNWKPDFLRA
ncbi:MAG: DUF6526 family protein [Candidatus Acidiferrales bacterium]